LDLAFCFSAARDSVVGNFTFSVLSRAAEKQKGREWVACRAINRQPRWGFEKAIHCSPRIAEKQEAEFNIFRLILLAGLTESR